VDLDGRRRFRRLELIGVGAPVVFLLGFEAFRITVLETLLPGPVTNLVAVTVHVVAAITFGIVIFWFIEHTERQLLRQNRDLAIVDGVASAIQGEVDVEQVLRAALGELARTTGAAEVRATLQPSDPDAGPAREVVVCPNGAAGDALAPPEKLVGVPLSASDGHVGRLQLRVPAHRLADLPSPEALHAVGHQVAAATRIAQLVEDLRRRKAEGHVLYQALLQISNQAPLPGILETIVEGARARLGADEGRICLASELLRAFENDASLTAVLADGIGCERPPAGEPAGAGPAAAGAGLVHHCGIETPRAFGGVLRTGIWAPAELLGEVWVARRAGPPFTERDRSYLLTLAGITAIAIAAARLRERERQAAVLAERDRIARELHDSLAQVLGSTHLRLRTLLLRPELAERRRIAGELEDLANVSEEAYRDVREAILGLRQASRTQGLLEALEAYVAKYAQQSGIPVELETATAGEPALSAGAEIQVIRVIQEALTNVRKHAAASSARVRIADGQAGGLMIVIEDDGRGFDPDAARVRVDGGYGLATMRERMELAGGSLRVDSSPGRGTRVVALLPEAARTGGVAAVGSGPTRCPSGAPGESGRAHR
jgi:signal transduction histidine kinase